MESTAVQIAVIEMDAVRWVGYIMVALIGGFASSLINNKGAITRIGWNDAHKKSVNVGPVADIMAGLAAALGILWTMTPQTVFQLLGMGAVAGYGGSSVLQALLNRLVADVSKTEKEKLEGEKKGVEDDKKKLEDYKAEIVEKEKELDRDKALKSVIEQIVNAKT